MSVTETFGDVLKPNICIQNLDNSLLLKRTVKRRSVTGSAQSLKKASILAQIKLKTFLAQADAHAKNDTPKNTSAFHPIES